MNKPTLSKQAFWDVDMDTIDYEKNALFIIENIVNNGSWEDFLSIRKFYGDKKISNIILSAKGLGPKEVNFCCVVFKLKPEDFIYPITKHLTPPSRDYYSAD